MHHLPIRLQEPVSTWDRSLPEHTLFARTISDENSNECEKFMDILDEMADRCKLINTSVTLDQLAEVNAALAQDSSEKFPKVLQLLHSMILRTPKDSPLLSWALKKRGEVQFTRYRFEDAVHDFTMFLHINKIATAEDLCEVHGGLTVAFYLMRQYSKTRKHLRDYNKYKSKLPREMFVNTHLERVDARIATFLVPLENAELLIPRIAVRNLCEPFKGFKVCKDIPAASTACLFKPATKKGPYGVFANSDIPKGGNVVVEKPIVHHVITPFLNCEYCFQNTNHIYSCLECRYKSYCSVKCMEDDSIRHKEECGGYRNLLLVMLDAREIFRIFLDTSYALNEHVFKNKIFRTLSKAAEVMDHIVKTIKQLRINCSPLLQLLAKKPEYEKLALKQYTALIETAFRLAIFIDKKTNIVKEYYKEWKMVDKQKIIALGSIIMRLHCHLLLNTMYMQRIYPPHKWVISHKNIYDQISQLAEDITPLPVFQLNAKTLYEVNENEVFEELFQTSVDNNEKENWHIEMQSPLDYIVHRPIHIYREKITEMAMQTDIDDSFLVECLFSGSANWPLTDQAISYIAKYISELDSAGRLNLMLRYVRLFHGYMVEYFWQLGDRLTYYRQMFLPMYSTIRKFKHSCEPNLELLLMEDGVVCVKTLRDIDKGEELLGRYKVHYMFHTTEDKKSFLKELDKECNCKNCKISMEQNLEDVRKGILCEDCSEIVTPAIEKCAKCGINYGNLRRKHENRLENLRINFTEREEYENTEADRYQLFMAICYSARKLFVPGHRRRLRAEINYAQFLALKNLALQSYGLLKHIIEDVKKYYWHSHVLFPFYDDILTTIKIILHYCLDRGFTTVPVNQMDELCTFGLEIVKKNKRHLLFYMQFNFAAASVMEDMQKFLAWKMLIRCSQVLADNVVLRYDEPHEENMQFDPFDETLPDLEEINS